MKDFITKNGKHILFIILIVAVVLLVINLTKLENMNKGGEIHILSKEEVESIEEVKINVEISGSVLNPGVYELEINSIVEDLINISGGLSENADTNYLAKNVNRAKKLEDQEKIYIPSIGENQVLENQTTETVSGKININTASKTELESLNGVGPSTSEKIITNRPYKSIEDIKKVSGIGDSLFEKIKNDITV